MKSKAPRYSTLDPEKIVATADKLRQRIAERFPGSGLSQVSAELTVMARETSARAEAIARPNWRLRAQVGFAVAAGVAILAIFALRAAEMQASNELLTVMQGLDAAVNLLIVFGGATLFLLAREGRLRRDQALAGLHEFRSIVHVIDMHQLTKDPTAFGAPRLSSSPEHRMTRHELLRYLNYCTELLSIASKAAALYAEKIRDPVVVDAVSDIEDLTTNLSQKIWQKITMVEERIPGRPASDAFAPKAAS